MPVEYSYKFRIYPNKAQEQLIIRTFGCCRYVYNHYLTLRRGEWENNKKTLNYYDCAADLTLLKATPECGWLKEVDSTALQSSLRDLDTAYKNFFRRINEGKEKPGYPRFKRKYDHRKSYKSKNTGKTIVISEKHIRLPKLGLVKCRVSKAVRGRILSATVSKNPAGQYYVSLCCTEVPVSLLPETGKSTGVDLGVKDAAITSDGFKYENNRYIYQTEKKIARLQKSFSRKKKGSKRWNKQRIQIAKLHQKTADRRNDYLHKMTTGLIRDYDTICIEDLDTKGMVKNHHLARAVLDVSFGELRRQLTYKAERHGRKIVVIDRFFPSSQLCSVCGYKNQDTKNLNIRAWTCPCCGTHHDRDINAAINIKKEGLRIAALIA